MDDATIKLVVLVCVVLNIAALALRRRSRLAVPGFNALVAVGVLIGVALQPHVLRPAIDWQVVGMAAAEAAVLGISMAAWRGWRPAGWLSVVAAVLHLFVGAAALLFVLTFKMTRLI